MRPRKGRNESYKNLTLEQKRQIKKKQKAQKISSSLQAMQVKTVNQTTKKLSLRKVIANEEITVQPLSVVQIKIEVESANSDDDTKNARYRIVSQPVHLTPQVHEQTIIIGQQGLARIANYQTSPLNIVRGQHIANALKLREPVSIEDISDESQVVNSINSYYPEIKEFLEELKTTQTETCPAHKAKLTLWDKIKGFTDFEKETILNYREIFIPEKDGEKFTFMKTPPATIPHSDKMPKELKPPYRKYLSPRKQQALDEFVADGLQSGKVEYVKNPTMASPAVILEKKDGSNRFLCDPRHINKHLHNVLTEAPDISNSTRNIATCKFWSKMDIKSAFQRQIVDPADRKFSAVLIPSGPYSGVIQFVGLGVGLKNSTSIFVHNLNNILRPLRVAVADDDRLKPMVTFEIFVDDLISGGATRQEAFHSLTKILAQLYKYSVKLDIKKTEFLTTKLEWCGNILENGEIKPDPDRFQKLQKLEIPSTLDPTHTKWRRVFGLFSYYRKYIPTYAEREQRIRNILEKCRLKSIEKLEKDNMIMKEIELFTRDIKAGCLTVPPADTPLIIQTDASNLAQAFVVSAINEVNGKRNIKPCWFGSKILSKVQQGYKTHEKELLAIITALDSCKHFISRASYVELESDNLTNVILLNNNGSVNELSGRALRLILQVQTRIDSDKIKFKHLSTLANFVADAASRLEFSDDENKGSINAITRSMSKRSNLNAQVKSIHEMTHCGKEKLFKTCQDYYKMNGQNLKQICEKVVEECPSCNRYTRILASTVLGTIQLPPKEFHSLVIDHVHLERKTSLGNRYILTVVCEFSRYLIAVLVPDKSMRQVATVMKLVLQLFPQVKVLRGDLAFEAKEIQELPVLKLEFSAAHNSRSNIGERCHRTMWEKIRVLQHELNLEAEELDIVLPKAVLAYNQQYHSSIGAMPVQFINTSNLPLKMTRNLQQLRRKVRDLHQIKMSKKGSLGQIPTVAPGTEILIRYHAKQRRDIFAIVLEDEGLVIKAKKKTGGRYSKLRVSKRHVFVKKEGTEEVYHKIV